MRRTALPSRWLRGAAIIVALASLVGSGTAGAGLPYDDRPALIASHSVENPGARATSIVDVNVADRAHTTEVTIRADGEIPYEVFELEGPDRLVFDFPGVMASEAAPRRHEVAEGPLVRVRLGQWQEDPAPVARVVMDMQSRMAWTVRSEGDALRVILGEEKADLDDPVDVVGEPIDAGTIAASETEAEIIGAEIAEAETTEAETTDAEITDAEITETVPVETLGEQTDGGPIDDGESRFAAAKQELRDAEPLTETAVGGEDETVETTPAPTATEADEPDVPEPATAPAASTASDTESLVTDDGWTTDDAAWTEAEPEPAPTESIGEWGEATPETPADVESTGDNLAGDDTNLDELVEEASLWGASPEPEVAPSATFEAEDDGTEFFLPDVETKTIQDEQRVYTGTPISLNLVDANIKDVFGLFHDLSGLNFVLDPAVGGKVTIVLDEVPWDQALDLILKNNGLDMALEGNVVRIAPVTKLAQEAAARKALREAKELEGPPVTITRTLSYARAEDVEQVVREAILSPRGRVIIDERTNSVIIRDISNRIEATDSLLETLDAETPQVMIEARIVEVSRDFVKDLGISWGFTGTADPALGTQTNLDFPHRGSVNYDLNLPANPAANALGFSFGNVLDSFTLDVTIDALENEGYARRLSAPKIATLNNDPAEIEQGVRFPIVSTTATEIDVRFVAASLRLECTPQITAEGTIILEITVENNQPDFVNTVGEVPSINTQRAETKVMIQDGGTTVIGGIFTVNEGKSEQGVPWLRKLKGVGWLFRQRNTQTRNRELLIFITPKIIKSA